MIPSPILYNNTTIMIGLVVCCLIVLAVVMIPKAIRHRKRVKQNESEKPAPDEEQELEMIVVPNVVVFVFRNWSCIFPTLS